MTDATASFHDFRLLDDRTFPFDACGRAIRRIAQGALVGIGGAGAMGAFVAIVMMTAAWTIAVALNAHANLQTTAKFAPLASFERYAAPRDGGLDRTSVDSTDALALQVKRARTLALAFRAEEERQASARQQLLVPSINEVRLSDQLSSPSSVVPLIGAHSDLFDAPSSAELAQLPIASVPKAPEPQRSSPPDVELADITPLPQPYPGKREIARAPADQPVRHARTQLASLEAPSVRDHVAPQSRGGSPVQQDGRTAIYDIAAHTVYLPSGERLEAHSGLGDKMDDPRYVRAKNRGPTPPNVYDLALREQLFHGVQAIRLKPLNESKMFGRDGMLAHTYMLGPNGQSNGCVSFRNYPRFLHAVKSGQVTRLVVVPHLVNSFWGTAWGAAGARNKFSGTASDQNVPSGWYADSES